MPKKDPWSLQAATKVTFFSGDHAQPTAPACPEAANEDVDRVLSAISRVRNAPRTRDEHSVRLKLRTEEKLPFRRKLAEKCGKRA
jgi:hypothetical protein